MRYFLRAIPFFILLGFLFSTHAWSQEGKFERKRFINWPDVSTIDIHDKYVGDFLDLNLDIFRKKAVDSYNAKQYEAAIKYYLVLVQHNIHDSRSIYNIACCYGLLGDADKAAVFLVRAVRAGYEDIEFIKNDTDFSSVRGIPAFDNTLNDLENLVSQKNETFGEVQYFDHSSLMRYRVHYPVDYDPEKSYPLVIGLHGYSGTPDQFVQIGTRFENTDIIYVAPQGPYPVPTPTGIGYSWYFMGNNESLNKYTSELSEDYILDLANELKKNHKIDGTYLLGFSQGCIMSFLIGIKNHDMFDGLICFGRWFEKDTFTDDQLDAAKDLRVFISQGSMDEGGSMGKAKIAYDILKEHDYNVEFLEFNGGHLVPTIAVQAADKWMFGE